MRWADCDSDHYLVITKLRERFLVAERMDQIVDIDLIARKLKDEEITLLYLVQISNRFDALRTSNEDAGEVDIKISEIISK